MASIEQRGRSFRVVFRYRGRRFARSLRTAEEKQATTTLARLEDNLRRVELGTLSVPEGSDVATFLLSDGRQSAKRERSEIRTLTQLLSSYFENIPSDSLEENTLDGMRTHRRHLERLLGQNLPIQALQFDDLQNYVDRRSQEPGQHGHTVRPATIKKELRTLNCVWNWAIDMRVVGNPLPKRVQSLHSMRNQAKRVCFFAFVGLVSKSCRIGLTKKRRLLRECGSLSDSTNTHSGKDASMQDRSLYSLFW